MAGQRAHTNAQRAVPQPRDAIVAAGRHKAAVAIVGDAAHGRPVAGQRALRWLGSGCGWGKREDKCRGGSPAVVRVGVAVRARGSTSGRGGSPAVVRVSVAVLARRGTGGRSSGHASWG
eukprot:218336-Chlamydomonas_euryale.AAC.1